MFMTELDELTITGIGYFLVVTSNALRWQIRRESSRVKFYTTMKKNTSMYSKTEELVDRSEQTTRQTVVQFQRVPMCGTLYMS